MFGPAGMLKSWLWWKQSEKFKTGSQERLLIQNRDWSKSGMISFYMLSVCYYKPVFCLLVVTRASSLQPLIWTPCSFMTHPYFFLNTQLFHIHHWFFSLQREWTDPFIKLLESLRALGVVRAICCVGLRFWLEHNTNTLHLTTKKALSRAAQSVGDWREGSQFKPQCRPNAVLVAGGIRHQESDLWWLVMP